MNMTKNKDICETCQQNQIWSFHIFTNVKKMTILFESKFLLYSLTSKKLLWILAIQTPCFLCYFFKTLNMTSKISPNKNLINLKIWLVLFKNPLFSDDENQDNFQIHKTSFKGNALWSIFDNPVTINAR